jgi:hypothetical protein
MLIRDFNQSKNIYFRVCLFHHQHMILINSKQEEKNTEEMKHKDKKKNCVTS